MAGWQVSPFHSQQPSEISLMHKRVSKRYCMKKKSSKQKKSSIIILTLIHTVCQNNLFLLLQTNNNNKKKKNLLACLWKENKLCIYVCLFPGTWRTKAEIPPGNSQWSALSLTTQEQPCCLSFLRALKELQSFLWHCSIVKVTMFCHKMATDSRANLAYLGHRCSSASAGCVVQEYLGFGLTHFHRGTHMAWLVI